MIGRRVVVVVAVVVVVVVVAVVVVVVVVVPLMCAFAGRCSCFLLERLAWTAAAGAGCVRVCCGGRRCSWVRSRCCCRGCLLATAVGDQSGLAMPSANCSASAFAFVVVEFEVGGACVFLFGGLGWHRSAHLKRQLAGV